MSYYEDHNLRFPWREYALLKVLASGRQDLVTLGLNAKIPKSLASSWLVAFRVRRWIEPIYTLGATGGRGRRRIVYRITKRGTQRLIWLEREKPLQDTLL